MNIRGIFTDHPKQRHPVFTYGFLVINLALLAAFICLRVTTPPTSMYSYDRDGNCGVVVLMLLLNHLAFNFRWSTSVTVTLRFLAFGSLGFMMFYIFYLSRILYSLPPHDLVPMIW